MAFDHKTAEAYLAERDYDRAIAECSRIIDAHPHDSTAHRIRGDAFEFRSLGRGEGSAQDHQQALNDYSKAIEIDPKDATAHAHRGRAYFWEVIDPDKAVADLTAAIELGPRPWFYRWRGDAYSQKDDLAAAITDYSKAIESDPGDSEAYTSRAWKYECQGEDDRAIADYTSAIEIRPQDDHAYDGRAAIYRKRGDYDKAIADDTAVIEIERRGIRYFPLRVCSAYVTRGKTRQAKGDFDGAIADFTAALEIKPQISFFHFRRQAYKAKGDLESAAADLRRADELYRAGKYDEWRPRWFDEFTLLRD